MNEPSPSDLTLCARHPGRPAIGTCPRCGSFYCQSCYKDLAGRRLCASCLEIPGVDYLKDFRDRHWGKRDGWIWYFGLLGSIGTVVRLVVGIERALVVEIVPSALGLAVLLPYFLQRKWARVALFACVPLWVMRSQAVLSAKISAPSLLGAEVAGTLLGMLFVAAAYKDTVNKLAFRIEVSDVELDKAYQRSSNGLAKRSFVYGIFALIIPLLGVATLVMGVLALRRTKPDAWPPIGGRGTAIAGIVLSVIGCLIWTAVAVGALKQ